MRERTSPENGLTKKGMAVKKDGVMERHCGCTLHCWCLYPSLGEWLVAASHISSTSALAHICNGLCADCLLGDAANINTTTAATGTGADNNEAGATVSGGGYRPRCLCCLHKLYNRRLQQHQQQRQQQLRDRLLTYCVHAVEGCCSPAASPNMLCLTRFGVLSGEHERLAAHKTWAVPQSWHNAKTTLTLTCLKNVYKSFSVHMHVNATLFETNECSIRLFF